MEAYELLIKDTRRWLSEVEKLDPKSIKNQLARLEISERVLGQIRLQSETGTHNETYQRVCSTFMDNILIITHAALISKATEDLSQGKSDILKTMQPMVEEIKGYLEKLGGKNNGIDLVMKEIEKKLERRNYKLTEEEKFEVEMLLMDVKAKRRQAKIYFEAANKTLESLRSKVISCKNEKGVNGWKVFQMVVAGALVGAVGAAFLPAVAPAAAVYGGAAIGGGAIGGGAIGGTGRFFYEKQDIKGKCEILEGESVKLQSRLNELMTELEAKEPVFDMRKEQIESKVRITGKVSEEI